MRMKEWERNPSYRGGCVIAFVIDLKASHTAGQKRVEDDHGLRVGKSAPVASETGDRSVHSQVSSEADRRDVEARVRGIFFQTLLTKRMSTCDDAFEGEARTMPATQPERIELTLAVCRRSASRPYESAAATRANRPAAWRQCGVSCPIVTPSTPLIQRCSARSPRPRPALAVSVSIAAGTKRLTPISGNGSYRTTPTPSLLTT